MLGVQDQRGAGYHNCALRKTAFLQEVAPQSWGRRGSPVRLVGGMRRDGQRETHSRGLLLI